MTGPFRALAGAALKQASRLAKLKRVEKYAAFVNLELPDYFYSRVTSPYGYFNRNKPSLYAADFVRSTEGCSPRT